MKLLHDPDGALRVVVPDRDLEYYLDLACGQVRRYGKAEPRVDRARCCGSSTAPGKFCPVDAGRLRVAQPGGWYWPMPNKQSCSLAGFVGVREHAGRVLRELSTTDRVSGS